MYNPTEKKLLEFINLLKKSNNNLAEILLPGFTRECNLSSPEFDEINVTIPYHLVSDTPTIYRKSPEQREFVTDKAKLTNWCNDCFSLSEMTQIEKSINLKTLEIQETFGREFVYAYDFFSDSFYWQYDCNDPTICSINILTRTTPSAPKTIKISTGRICLKTKLASQARSNKLHATVQPAIDMIRQTPRHSSQSPRLKFQPSCSPEFISPQLSNNLALQIQERINHLNASNCGMVINLTSPVPFLSPPNKQILQELCNLLLAVSSSAF